MQNPICSVLEVVILVCHYGSDRPAALPKLILVSKATVYFAQVVVSRYLLTVQSARSTLTVSLIVCERLVFFYNEILTCQIWVGGLNIGPSNRILNDLVSVSVLV